MRHTHGGWGARTSIRRILVWCGLLGTLVGRMGSMLWASDCAGRGRSSSPTGDARSWSAFVLLPLLLCCSNTRVFAASSFERFKCP